MKRTKCEECNAYNSHSPLCSKIDLTEAKKQLERYYSLWLSKEEWVRRRIKFHENRHQLWKGKFYEVKHENNELRKRVAKDI